MGGGEQAVGVMAEAVVKVVEAWKEGATVEEKKLWQGGWWEPRTGDWWGARGRGWIRRQQEVPLLHQGDSRYVAREAHLRFYECI